MLNLTNDLKNILLNLVDIKSFTNNEKEIAEFINKTLSSLEINNIYNIKNNLIYYYNSTKSKFTQKETSKKKTIALIGHLDTVEPFIKARFDSNTIYGRGAVDMKAGLAVMLKLIYQLSKQIISSQYNIYFVFYTKEEGPLPNGLSQILNDNILEDIYEAIILEPTKEKILTGCLGTASYEIEIQGKSSHSANPKHGINAIYESIRLINIIRKYDNILKKQTYKNVYPSINITQINTNNPKNMIPGKLKLLINLRFTPSMLLSRDKAINYLKENIIKNIELEYTIKLIDFAPSVDNQESKLFNHKAEMFQAWADIAQLNEHNIRGVLFGPGDIRFAHSIDEQINIKELDSYSNKLEYKIKEGE